MYKLDNHRYPTTEQGCRRWSPNLISRQSRKTTVMMAIFAACRKIRGAMIIFWSARVNMAQWMFLCGPDAEANTADDITNWSLDKK